MYLRAAVSLPGSIFALALAAEIAGEDVAQAIQLGLEYDRRTCVQCRTIQTARLSRSSS